jgi:malonyl-CoA/methylmalonyl-CoA synthetase
MRAIAARAIGPARPAKRASQASASSERCGAERLSVSALLEGFLRTAAARGSAPALRDGSGATSYEELVDRCRGVAQYLENAGWAGGRVALLVAGAAFPVGVFGVLLSGSTVVPLSPLHPLAEQEGFVRASGARGLLRSRACAPGPSGIPGALLDDIAPLRKDEFQGGAAGQETALILYTSGTTGKPKGVLLTHDNVHALSSLLGKAWGFTDRDTLLHALPLHHLHGIGVSLLVALATGAQTVLMPRFDPAAVWEAMGSATVFMGVPTQHRRLLDVFDAAGAPVRERWRGHARGLRLITSGSAALPVALAERWRTLTGAYPLERYGMTEVGIALANPLDGERRPGTVGHPLPGMQVRLVTEGGREALPGEIGEIQVRGPTVFAGYDGDPDATAASFDGDWFRTGDTATVTTEGYVKILGRTSLEILKSGGYKLSALEIEEVLRECPAVADIAVVGVPDPTWGDLVVAVVVPAVGRDAEVAEPRLRAWAKERLAPYKVPKRVVLTEALPRNALGKVQKPELIRWATDRVR